MRSLSPFVVTVALLATVGGCDPTFDSFEDNGWDYSVFGYLDARADTHFVRVEPLRDSMLIGVPESIGAEVTLTHVETGRTVTLRDSLFRYLDEATAHNFYTTANIEPRATYWLEVEGPHGASRARTTVPDLYPTPTVDTPAVGTDCSPREPNARIRIRGIPRLVAVKALYYRRNPHSIWGFDHLPDTLQQSDGSTLAQINYGSDICDVPRDADGARSVYRIEVVVAAGDPDWPDFMSLDSTLKTLPRGSSNVEGGVGFVGGIVSDTVAIYPAPNE